MQHPLVLQNALVAREVLLALGPFTPSNVVLFARNCTALVTNLLLILHLLLLLFLLLLRLGCACRLTAEIMLEEIGRRPGAANGEEGPGVNGGAVTQDREGYALAAGLALGLVTLGRGQNAPGLSDIQIADRLRSALVPGPMNTDLVY